MVLSAGEAFYLYKKDVDEKLFKVGLGGYKADAENISYVMNSKKDLGVLVRLCSDSGSLFLADINGNHIQTIDNHSDERTVLRLIYY